MMHGRSGATQVWRKSDAGLRRSLRRVIVQLSIVAYGEERFLSAQADAFAGANAEENIGLLRSK